jgi:CHASE3 domain sensor protein
MEYTDDDIAFAYRLIHERETLDDKEVEEWIKSPVHRRLMNEMEGVRRQWEAEATSGNEQERLARAGDEEKSRRMTLRWAIVIVIILVVVLVVNRLIRGEVAIH